MFDIKNIINKLILKTKKSDSEKIFFSTRRELQHRVADIIINSLDPEELKNKIIKELAIVFDANRCFFMEYDSSTNNFKEITNSYNTRKNSLRVLGYDMEKATPNMTMKQKYMKTLVISDTKKFIKENNLEESKEDLFFKELNVKSSISVRLEFGDIFLGVITVHFDKKKFFLEKTTLNCLKDLAEHISIALYLSKLYATEKAEKAKESLLRTIISIMIKDDNIDEVTQKIFEILGNIYNVKTGFVDIDFSDYQKSYYYNLSLSGIDNLKVYNKNALIKIYKMSDFNLNKNDAKYIPDTHNFIIQNNLENSSIDKYFTKNEIEAVILLPLKNENIYYGFLIIHFDKKNPITADDLEFLKIVTSQLALSIKQGYNYQKERKTAIRESLSRKIIETIRDSLDIQKTKQTIVDIIGKTLNADRCFIIEYDEVSDKFLKVETEYLSSKELLSYCNEDINESVPIFTAEFKKGKRLIFNQDKSQIDGLDINLNDIRFEKERLAIDKYKVYSALAFPIKHLDCFMGNLIIHYVDKKHKAGEDEILFVESIANQIAIALHQANLYNETRLQAKRDRLLTTIIETIRSSLDPDETLSFICKETSKVFNVQRTGITTFFKGGNSYDISLKKEYKSSPEYKGIMDTENITEIAIYWRDVLLKESDIVYIDNLANANASDFFKNIYCELGVKSLIGVAIKSNAEILGCMVLSEYNNYRHWSDEEKSILKAISNQIYIAIHQAELYTEARDLAHRETLLRTIIQKMRSTIEVNLIMHEMVTQIGLALKADRVAFAEYSFEKENYFTIEENEYRSSENVKTFVGYDFAATLGFIDAIRKVHLTGKDIVFNDLEKYLEENNIQHSGIGDFYRDMGFQSSLAININHENSFYGNLVITFEKKRIISKSDIEFVKTLANQAAIAIHQFNLYKTTKLQSERERLNKNILEILRSSLEKETIKTLFVKNIGKYFNADRVFFADYDSEKKIYLPVEKTSEYLSDNTQKSFVGIDWSNEMFIEYISPLLEKRESKINCIDTFENSVSEIIINRYQNFDVKSSYNLPVIYEGQLLGFFCIEFTQNECHQLIDEDINSIRNMCTQAAIALYHADLYQKAKGSSSLKQELIDKIISEVKEPLKNIEDLSDILSRCQLNCDEEYMYLETINKCLNELTNTIENIAHDPNIK